MKQTTKQVQKFLDFADEARQDSANDLTPYQQDHITRIVEQFDLEYFDNIDVLAHSLFLRCTEEGMVIRQAIFAIGESLTISFFPYNDSPVDNDMSLSGYDIIAIDLLKALAKSIRGADRMIFRACFTKQLERISYPVLIFDLPNQFTLDFGSFCLTIRGER